MPGSPHDVSELPLVDRRKAQVPSLRLRWGLPCLRTGRARRLRPPQPQPAGLGGGASSTKSDPSDGGHEPVESPGPVRSTFVFRVPQGSSPGRNGRDPRHYPA